MDWPFTFIMENMPVFLVVLMCALVFRQALAWLITIRRGTPEPEPEPITVDPLAGVNAPDEAKDHVRRYNEHFFFRQQGKTLALFPDGRVEHILSLQEQEAQLAELLHQGRGPTAMGAARADELIRKYPSKSKADKTGKCRYCNQKLTDGQCTACGAPQE